MAEDFEQVAKRRIEAIFQRAELFSNLNLSSVPDMVNTASEIGIPKSEFRPNNNSTAPFNFLVQIGALHKEVKEFDEYFEDYDANDEMLRVCKNHIFWLAASLFKLNLHLAADPLGLYDSKDQSAIHNINGIILEKMGGTTAICVPLIEAFKLLREFSYLHYKAHLEGSDDPQITIHAVASILEKFDNLSPAGRFIGLAAIMAYGYTVSLFAVGTRKDLAENVKVNFSVERGKSGYQRGVVINAFHTRFAKYAASYAHWYELDDRGNLKDVQDIGDFSPKKQIVLQIDNQFVYVVLPESAALAYTVGNHIEFAQLISQNKLDKKIQLVMFPMF